MLLTYVATSVLDLNTFHLFILKLNMKCVVNDACTLPFFSATLGPDNLNCPVTEEEVLESIKDQIHSAASLVCYLSRDFTFSGPQVSFVDDIVGVVALLGTVRTSEQSR